MRPQLAAPSLTAVAAHVVELVDDERLRRALVRSFVNARTSVDHIQSCFDLIPTRRWSPELFATFFHSWKATHLKMLAIYGLSCRMQRLAMAETHAFAEDMFVAAALNAETSYEDLGLDYQGVTHADLYDDLARTFVRSDAWVLPEHGIPEALEFKRWIYERMVVDDISTGLLTNMFSEIYNHAEYTVALASFTRLVDTRFELSEPEREHALRYIAAHVVDETEVSHFLVVVEALSRYNASLGLRTDYDRAERLFTEYLDRLGTVMARMRLRMERELRSAV